MARNNLIFLAAVAATALPLWAADPVHPARDVYDGWRVGPMSYSFNQYTFFEAIDKAAELGASWMESFPGQKLSKDSDAKFDPSLSPELRQQVKQRLAEHGIKLVGYGVTGLPNNEAEARKVFDFCKDMGIENIASEPEEAAFDLLDKLAQEYKIGVAIHNHPEPSPYWNPDTVLKVCQGRSKYIGSCADTGHWTRSGVDPLEAVKKLKDRILYFHFKDLNEFGNKGAHDVPWGTGKSKAGEILQYLNQIGWKGYFSSEYEYNWTTSVPEIRASFKWFEKTAAGLKPTGWKPLLADDLSNCTTKGNWTLKEDLLDRTDKGGDIWTKDTYGNFILDLEFKVEKGTNSGVFLRTADIANWLHTGIEIQIADSAGQPLGKQICGAVYDCLEPMKNPTKPAGEWNHMTIWAKDNSIKIAMNGVPILDMDLNRWTTAHKNPDGTDNKFNTAYKDMAKVGVLGFQDHGTAIGYRNIKVKKI
jgi:sugar phosphate isomerase/epimerase